jgi:hypothetical protein
LGLGIHKYQDQIQELSGQVTQPIKDALEPLGNNVKDKILVFLGNVKEKVTSLPWAFSSTEDNGHSADGISIRHPTEPEPRE